MGKRYRRSRGKLVRLMCTQGGEHRLNVQVFVGPRSIRVSYLCRQCWLHVSQPLRFVKGRA